MVPALGPRDPGLYDAHRAHVPSRKWYHLARWKHPQHGLRAFILRRDPLCVDCLLIQRDTPSREADHEIPHRGDPVLFWDPLNLRGRCKPCHTRKTGRGE
jgi:5-methylcytosine-specific restriction protein A